jgi:hypothetical protein
MEEGKGHCFTHTNGSFLRWGFLQTIFAMSESASADRPAYVKFNRSLEFRELIRSPKNHNAFILLCVIAQRAWRLIEPNPDGMTAGQAMIGDFAEYGLTEQEYRTAKTKLEKWGYATFKATTRGTVATICNTKVFDINIEGGNGQSNSIATDEQRTSNGQATTNKNSKKEKNNKKERKEGRAPAPLVTFEESTIADFAIFSELVSGDPYDQADKIYYFEVIRNWSNSKAEKKRDWVATSKNWILRDFSDGKMKKAGAASPGNANGRTSATNHRSYANEKSARDLI